MATRNVIAVCECGAILFQDGSYGGPYDVDCGSRSDGIHHYANLNEST